MKIIEGQFAGKQIQYKEQKGTRVTSEKVRKAVFDVLKGLVEFEGLNVADLFCGSGMYGVEAMSRGAKEVLFLDNNKSILKQLKENLSQLKVESLPAGEAGYKVESGKFENFIVHYGSTQEHGTNTLFDLVFADPPYYEFDFQKFNNIYKILNTEGIFVLESSKRIEIGSLQGLKLIIEKKYGDSVVRFFKKK